MCFDCVIEVRKLNIDMNAQGRLVNTPQAEFAFGARHLVPGPSVSQARVVTPRPAKVLEDGAVQFANGLVHVIAAITHPQDLGRSLVEEYLVVWDNSRSSNHRAEINVDFVKR